MTDTPPPITECDGGVIIRGPAALARIIRMTSGKPAGVDGQPVAPPPDPEADPEMFRLWKLANGR